MSQLWSKRWQVRDASWVVVIIFVSSNFVTSLFLFTGNGGASVTWHCSKSRFIHRWRFSRWSRLQLISTRTCSCLCQCDVTRNLQVKMNCGCISCFSIFRCPCHCHKKQWRQCDVSCSNLVEVAEWRPASHSVETLSELTLPLRPLVCVYDCNIVDLHESIMLPFSGFRAMEILK